MLTVIVDENIEPAQSCPRMSKRMAAGSPAQVADQIKTKVLDAGIDGVIINIPNVHARRGHRGRRGLRPLLGCRGVTAGRSAPWLVVDDTGSRLGVADRV